MNMKLLIEKELDQVLILEEMFQKDKDKIRMTDLLVADFKQFYHLEELTL